MSDQALLQFHEADFSAGEPYDIPLRGISLTLGPSEVALVRPRDERDRCALADAAMGLWEPVKGQVLFEGKAWGKRSPQHAAAARYRIGRVFHECAWVSNLDVEENMLLAARHHTRHDDEELSRRLQEICARLEIEPKLKSRPGKLNRYRLKQAQWVRCLLGDPALLVLELPTEGIREPGAWMQEMTRQRERGAAMLWICNDPQVWDHPSMADAQRYRLEGECLLSAEEPDVKTV